MALETKKPVPLRSGEQKGRARFVGVVLANLVAGFRRQHETIAAPFRCQWGPPETEHFWPTECLVRCRSTTQLPLQHHLAARSRRDFLLAPMALIDATGAA
jgi:hypothetical protein